jgi:hypothetical protein
VPSAYPEHHRWPSCPATAAVAAWDALRWGRVGAWEPACFGRPLRRLLLLSGGCQLRLSAGAERLWLASSFVVMLPPGSREGGLRASGTARCRCGGRASEGPCADGEAAAPATNTRATSKRNYRPLRRRSIKRSRSRCAAAQNRCPVHASSPTDHGISASRLPKVARAETTQRRRAGNGQRRCVWARARPDRAGAATWRSYEASEASTGSGRGSVGVSCCWPAVHVAWVRAGCAEGRSRAARAGEMRGDALLGDHQAADSSRCA